MFYQPEEVYEMYSALPDDRRQTEFIKTEGVASYMRVTDARVRQLAREQRLPAFKMGGQFLIHLPTVKKDIAYKLSKPER